MPKHLSPDICVIGAGSGGLSVAAAAAAFGVEVVLVERGKMGGDCLNYGCVPSKALIAAGKRAHAMRTASIFGIGAVEPAIDFTAVHTHVRKVIDAIAPNDSIERFEGLGVTVLQAEGRFVDEKTLAAGDHLITARRFVIATGSSPVIPPIPGIDTVDALTNETIFDLEELPAQLIIIGGGPIGLELAQAHRRLGARVTVVEAQACLSREDPELAAIALDTLREEGIALHDHHAVTRIERTGSGLRLFAKPSNGDEIAIEGSHLLVAAGRAPNLASLDLDAAKVRFDKKGISVDAGLRSSNRRVYAIGDVAGGPQFTHVANYHAGIVIRALLFRLPAKIDYSALPRATFLDPELVQVGLTEAEARKAHGDIRTLAWPVHDNDRAQAERETKGVIKLMADRRGRIVGVSILAKGASEMGNFWSLALSKKMRLRDLTGFVSPYPTVGEIGKRAAMSYFGGMARKPLIRRIVRLLRVFG
ncbi:MAG: FAD-dependent oxidoreductase [Rhizobiaceae bacterium]|nr:FAD-dependent oxidoreductase [Rhizobiaceae bacterium]